MDAHGNDSIGTITISGESLTSVPIARDPKSYQFHMSMEPVKQ